MKGKSLTRGWTLSFFCSLTVVLSMLPGCAAPPQPEELGADASFAIDPIADSAIDEAVGLRLQRIDLAPESPEAWFDLARTLHANRLDEAAQRAYHKGLELRPSDREARYLLAHVLMRRGQAAEAVSQLESLSAASQTDQVMERVLADWALGLGEVEIAERAARRSSELAPGDAAAHSILARVLIQTDRPEEAITELQPFIALTVHNGYLDYLYGTALAAAGRRDEAAAVLSSLPTSPPMWPDPIRESLVELQAGIASRQEAAQSQFDAGEYAVALESVRQLQRVNPDLVAAVLLEALCLRRLGRFDEAIEVLSSELERRPNNYDLLYQSAATQAMIGDAKRLSEHFETAHSLAEAAIVLDSQRYEGYGIEGGVQLWLGRREKALAAFQRCAEIAPISPANCPAKVGNTMIYLGRLDEGLEVLRAAAKAQPLEPAPVVTLAVQLRDAGRDDELAALLSGLEEGGAYAADLLAMVRRALESSQSIEAPSQS